MGFFSTCLSRLLNSSFVVSTPSVFFPLSNFQSSPALSLSNFLIVTILYWVWTARNLATFSNSTLGIQQVIDLFKHDIRSRIRCATLYSVRNIWSLQSVFCSIDDNDNITFLL